MPGLDSSLSSQDSLPNFWDTQPDPTPQTSLAPDGLSQSLSPVPLKALNVKAKPVPPPEIMFDAGPLEGTPVPNLLKKGTIDLNHRPGITNDDGTVSSIFSFTIPLNKDEKIWKGRYEKAPKYALVPSIVDGKFLSPNGKMPSYANKDPKTLTPKQRQIQKQQLGEMEDEVRKYYQRAHDHLGIFSSSNAADKYAGMTHAYTPDGTDKKVYHPSYKNTGKE